VSHRASRTPRQSFRIAIGIAVTTLLAVAPPPRLAFGSSPTDPLAARLITLVNAHRASLSRPPLAWSQPLADVSQAHTEDMVNRGFFSHTNPDGVTFGARLQNSGIAFVSASENIAAGFSTADAVFSAWLLSPGHRSNLENPNFTHHGIGTYQDYWTHNFIQSPSGPVGVDEPGPARPGIRMMAFPCPARSWGRVRFTLPVQERVTLRVLGVSGRDVARPVDDQTFGAGSHEIALAPEHYDPGMYVLVLQTGATLTTAKFLVVR
jgi:uncharacterized protein YkwD